MWCSSLGLIKMLECGWCRSGMVGWNKRRSTQLEPNSVIVYLCSIYLHLGTSYALQSAMNHEPLGPLCYVI
ncbi:hypothetical protein BJX70DRAFT_384485 [Aspergillus crustosus]